jgi:hypothetical protein
LTHGSTATSAFVSGYSTGLRVAALIVFAGAALAAWMLRGTCDDPKREPVGMPEPLPVAA